MRAGGALLILTIGLALPSFAEAPVQSLRPLPRPEDPAEPVVVRIEASALAPGHSLRPMPRPGPEAADPVAALPFPDPEEEAEAEETGLPEALVVLLEGANAQTAVAASLRPVPRPPGLAPTVRVSGAGGLPSRVTQPGRYEPLCGASGILGERVAPVRGRISGCGIDDPVRVRAVEGLALSQSATINCDTALALRDWVSDAVLPVVGDRGGGAVSLRVVASYSCRTRNNQPGARLSEHATGNAVDIAGIGLANGDEISLLDDWGNGRDGRILRRLHEAACGPFGTVLGPESDRYHQDHFHFDVAAYRSGPYCR